MVVGVIVVVFIVNDSGRCGFEEGRFCFRFSSSKAFSKTCGGVMFQRSMVSVIFEGLW